MRDDVESKRTNNPGPWNEPWTRIHNTACYARQKRGLLKATSRIAGPSITHANLLPKKIVLIACQPIDLRNVNVPTTPKSISSQRRACFPGKILSGFSTGKISACLFSSFFCKLFRAAWLEKRGKKLFLYNSRRSRHIFCNKYSYQMAILLRYSRCNYLKLGQMLLATDHRR